MKNETKTTVKKQYWEWVEPGLAVAKATFAQALELQEQIKELQAQVKRLADKLDRIETK